MPLYQYRCVACLATAEAVRKVTNRHRGPLCRHPARPGDELPVLVPGPNYMRLEIVPVPGIVRNPAAGPRRG